MPENSSARLLDAALTEFSKHGYGGASVADVCAAAGVTKPTLYHFFGSKEGLFAAVVSHYGDQLTEQLRQIRRYDGHVGNTLNRIALSELALARSGERFYRLMFLVWSGPRQSATTPAIDLGLLHHEMLREVFLAAEADRGNMRGRAERFAISFQATLNAYASWGWEGRVDIPEEELSRELVRQFMHGIFS